MSSAPRVARVVLVVVAAAAALLPDAALAGPPLQLVPKDGRPAAAVKPEAAPAARPPGPTPGAARFSSVRRRRECADRAVPRPRAPARSDDGSGASTDPCSDRVGGGIRPAAARLRCISELPSGYGARGTKVGDERHRRPGSPASAASWTKDGIGTWVPPTDGDRSVVERSPRATLPT